MQTEQQKTPKDISHVYSSENLLIPDVEGPPRLIEAQIYYKYQNTFLKKDLKRVFDNAATNGLAASGALIEVEGVLYLRENLFWKWLLGQTVKPASEVQS